MLSNDDDLPAIEHRWRVWLAEVEKLTGFQIDVREARLAFECDLWPKCNISPQEYVRELHVGCIRNQ